MIKKSVFTGVIVGLILTIILLYPVFVVFVGRVLPSIGDPLSEVLGDIPILGSVKVSMTIPLLMAMAGAASLVALGLGSIAAWRSKANHLRQGALSGAISGLFAGFVLYIFLVSPTTTVLAGASLLKYQLDPMTMPNQGAEYPIGMAVPFARTIILDELRYLLLTVLFCLVLGVFEGAVVGWARRKHHGEACPTSLIDCIGDRQGYRIWFQNYDEPVMAGLVTGILGGAILVLTNLLHQNVITPDADPQSQWLSLVFSSAAGFELPPLVQYIVMPLTVLLSFLVIAGIGGAAAYLPKNPAGFLHSRLFSAAVSGTMTGLVISFPIASYFRFMLALLPQFVVVSSSEAYSDAVANLVVSVPGRVMLMYLFPLPLVAGVVLVLTLWGLLQGMIYGLVFSSLRLRPVDRASIARREFLQRSNGFLPRLYTLFQNDRQALLVIEHLAFSLRRDPNRARLVAAYHTLGTNPDQAVRALNQISDILESQPSWKLRSEIQALYHLLAQGLSARTVAQIAMISPVPEDQTSSLLPPLAKAGEYLSQPLIELKKVERVDDLDSKIIFLGNAIEALRKARIFCEGPAQKNFVTPLPEITVLHTLLDHWESVILNAIRDIRGRAEITAVLKSNKLAYSSRLVLGISLENRGLNVAERVSLSVDDFSDDYQVVEGRQQTIDILAPSEKRELSFTIHPLKERGQLRVGWKIAYGDALKPDYVLEFADQIEFLEVEKPFQRIFPIPYVTGTPLQSSEMFVGRKDVFAFVRENLFGKYQNNVIVLHGQRRTGKSSILYHLGQELAGSHVCVLIDMQGKAARGEVDFLYSIADDIVYTLENHNIFVELPARKDFEESPEFFFRSRFLRSIYDALGDKNLMLMFDEFEELQKRVEDGKLSEDIFPYLRNLMQHERKLDFIFAGTHKLEELAAEYWSILFNIAIYKRITFLDPQEVAWLITQPVLPGGMEYDPLAIERIYQVASGHPYFTQVVCHEMVAYHNETQRSYMTVTDVENALERILERGEAHFKYIWAESGTAQRLVLLALAEFMETAETATLEDIEAVLERRGRPLQRDALLDALSNLEARDILMRSGPRSSLYRFRVDLIRRWLYAARPSYEKVM